jgi:lipoate-protein ligase A
MGGMWRVIDTGLRSAAQNVALDRALLEARRAEEIPSTLRFSRFAPSVLLACHQSAAQEFDLDCCNAGALAVQRRITGGDAMFCAGTELGWSLYLHRRDVGAGNGMQAVARRICHAAAAAVAAFGADARFRARHDIEVDGRKIGSAGGVFDGCALLYQGVLHLELDVAAMVRAMRTPAHAPPEHVAAAARERVTDIHTVQGKCVDAAELRRNLCAAFESEFAVELHDSDLSLTEHVRYQRALAEIAGPGWVHYLRQPGSDVTVCAATQAHAGGMLAASVLYDCAQRRIKDVWFTVDGGVEPRRVLIDFESALRDTAVERLARNVSAFFAGRAVAMPGLTPRDFVAVVRRALKLPLVMQ